MKKITFYSSVNCSCWALYNYPFLVVGMSFNDILVWIYKILVISVIESLISVTKIQSFSFKCFNVTFDAKPTRSKYKLKHGDYESIHMVYKVKGQNSLEWRDYSRLGRECMWPNKKDWSPEESLTDDWKVAVRDQKTKVSYKLTSKHRDLWQILSYLGNTQQM